MPMAKTKKVQGEPRESREAVWLRDDGTAKNLDRLVELIHEETGFRVYRPDAVRVAVEEALKRREGKR